MLTLRITEYFFYRLADNDIDLYLLVVFLIDPAVWEMENMLLPIDSRTDPTLFVASI